MKGLGCSTSVIIILGIAFTGLIITGLLMGPIGAALFGTHPPSWLDLHPPKVELPGGPIFNIAGFVVTNTLIAALVTTLTLLVIAVVGARKLKLVPGRFQALLEIIIETLFNFCTSIAGPRYGRRFFPIVATIFLFVAFNAYLALLPIYHTIYLGDYPILRAANTDVNLPLAIAICAFVFIEYWGIRALGAGHYLSEFFNFKLLGQGIGAFFTGKLRNGIVNIFYGVINVFIGFIELLSHLVRLVSFTFRLFGNMTAGEILLLMVTFLVPFIAVLPFYGLELIVGVIQALIFAGLTLVFATIAVKAGGGEEHEH